MIIIFINNNIHLINNNIVIYFIAIFFLKLSIVAMYSLYPLFNGIQEKFTKLFILIVYIQCAYELILHYYDTNTKHITINTNANNIVYCIVFVCIVVTEFLSYIYEKRYPFLSILLTSSVCAVINITLWIEYLYIIIQDINIKTKNKNKLK